MFCGMLVKWNERPNSVTSCARDESVLIQLRLGCRAAQIDAPLAYDEKRSLCLRASALLG